MPPIKKAFQPTDGLSFSARDLLARLVREDGAIRGRLTILTEPLWLHRGTCPKLPYKPETCASCRNTDLSNFGRIRLSRERNCTAHPRRKRNGQAGEPLLMLLDQRRFTFIENNYWDGKNSCANNGRYVEGLTIDRVLTYSEYRLVEAGVRTRNSVIP